MKKKVLTVTLVLMILGVGVVSAATKWGKFEGYDIIRLMINGKEAKVLDVPAVSLNNRTMVPIYMLREAGLNVSWDGKNSTVSVTNNKNDNNQKLKDYFLIADYYKRSSDLGDSLGDISRTLSLAYDGITRFNSRKSLDNVYDYLETTISGYNTLVEFSNNNKDLFSSLGLNYERSNYILNQYYDAIEYYKESLSNLESFYKYNTKSYDDKYFDNSVKGFDTSFNGLVESDNQYNIIKYKILYN